MVLTAIVWQGQRFGHLISAAAPIKQEALAAIGQLRDGQAALAQGDFASSAQAFSQAQALVDAAQGRLAHVVDIPGTVASGEHLLAAAKSISQVGSDLSVIGERLAQNNSLSDVIGASRPQLEDAVAQLTNAQALLGKVSPTSVPEGAREELRQLQATIPAIRQLLTFGTAQIDAILSLLGADHDRQYLLLLANNHELRPVGGFIGTTALVHVSRGKVENIDVSSVYDGDGQLNQFIAPPDELLPIVNRWYLRDTNWFVDFPVDARKAAEFFEKEGGPTVDGVILLTPDIIKRLLEVTGPVSVPGYDQTVSAENFVATTQQEVTYDYDKSLNRPKQFLADLTPLLLNRVFQQPQSKLPLLRALTEALSHKEMLLYFRDNDIEQRVKDLNWAGAMPANIPGLLHVNNANIGGHKSDQFVDQEIDQRVQVLPDGGAEVVLTIRRTHRGPFEAAGKKFPEGENPAQKNNVIWERVLAPKGATLLEAKGFTPSSDIPRYASPESDVSLVADADLAAWQSGQQIDSSGTIIGHEAGYTFFGNWIVTEPGQTSVALYRYKIPAFVDMPGLFKSVSSGAVTFVKQSGAARTTLRVEVHLPDAYRIVSTVPIDGITRESDTSMVYRGDAATDQTIGFVFEKR